MSLKRLQDWQYNNVQRACNEAVREALSYGVDADELRNILAECWEEVLRDKARFGRETIEKRV